MACMEGAKTLNPLLHPPSQVRASHWLNPSRKPVGQGAQVVLSVAVSLPGQEKGRVDLHSVSDLVTNLTL